MTTALAILTQALRECNLIAIGQSPSTTQQTEGFARLNALVSSVLGYEVGEKLHDWMVGVENVQLVDRPFSWNSEIWKYPPVNSRLMCNSDAAQTIYLPANPCDGARVAVQDVSMVFATNNLTLDGNGRLIESNETLVLTTTDLIREWMYRADLGDWVRTATLVSATEMPYPTEFDDYFITMLAMRLNPRYGRTTSEETKMFLQRSESQIRARYRQTIVTPADPGVLAMSQQAYNSTRQYYWGGRGSLGWMQ